MRYFYFSKKIKKFQKVTKVFFFFNIYKKITFLVIFINSILTNDHTKNTSLTIIYIHKKRLRIDLKKEISNM